MRRIVACGLAALAAITLRPVPGFAAPEKVACTLLTPAQVGTALGGPVGVGKPMTKPVCQWSQPKGGDDLKLEVSLTTLDRYNRFKTATSSATITAVANLGDEAYYSTQTAKEMQVALVIRKGDTAVIIHVSGGNKPAAEYQSKEKAIAEVLLPAL